ncbi:TauD/TfdA family dioxygenase [Variovorax saccharolyticus]|uniref:TauD/TfdA family dioxygenase n=1 Tax=Variovorax saccharolyticus TaxID=3053516 RepID=UPI0025749A8F|nr:MULTISPECIES: TauD/TfdA family dioxygenase [unclassified Variovorax]MDM0022372.1 TauD/TfdA family dioxygenase [Variovorax sp. J22R187]MDM0029028.1 TauD/TfdA family dioxygenase [Variovorax sp. J31P216]
MNINSSPTHRAYAHRSAWHGDRMAQRDDWIFMLTPEHNAEIRAALLRAKQQGARIPALAKQHFALPTLGAKLLGIRDEIVNGIGFALVRGLEIDELTLEDTALVYWGIGSYLGAGKAQNAQGDMLGHVTDLGVDYRTDMNVRGYQTRLGLPFHNDAQDVVGLLCLRPAREGGKSRIVSSTAIHNVVFERRPDLLAELYRPIAVDRRGEAPEGKLPYYRGCVFEWIGERLFCRYNRTYMESAQRFDGVPALTSLQIEAFELMDDLCRDPALYLDMDFQRGDMQFISNYSVLHSRTEYTDWPELDRRRYLLRLWLDTGLIEQLPESYRDRYEDMKIWGANPKPPIFDHSARSAELAH